MVAWGERRGERVSTSERDPIVVFPYFLSRFLAWMNTK
jgi:hypothetical protein